MELEAERISPTLTSRYMSNYITSPTDIYNQSYHSPRQNMQSFYPVMDNDRNYLKRHYYVKDELDGDERERKYEKLDQTTAAYPHAYHTNDIYDTYNNNLYPEPQQQQQHQPDHTVVVDNSASTATTLSQLNSSSSNDNYPVNSASPASSIDDEKVPDESPKSVVSGKKTKGRVKIKMEYIENKLRRYTTFSKRKTGIMKKAYELSTLTGTQVMLLVASETGHVYTFATRKLQPMITSDAGKQLIQTCLNSPESGTDPSGAAINGSSGVNDQRMSATGFEETELTFDIQELNEMSEKQKVRQQQQQQQQSYNSSSSSVSSVVHHVSVSQALPSSHSHLYTIPHPPAQHYSPQGAHHYSSPHYSPPSPSLNSQHFQAPPPSQYPSYYENTGNPVASAASSQPLSSYQSIRSQPAVPISPPANASSTEATR